MSKTPTTDSPSHKPKELPTSTNRSCQVYASNTCSLRNRNKSELAMKPTEFKLDNSIKPFLFYEPMVESTC